MNTRIIRVIFTEEIIFSYEQRIKLRMHILRSTRDLDKASRREKHWEVHPRGPVRLLFHLVHLHGQSRPHLIEMVYFYCIHEKTTTTSEAAIATVAIFPTLILRGL
jgi:hypothetical protein